MCDDGFCSTLLYDTCCESDGNQVTCPAFTACGNDEECDDANGCTNDECNTYLFGGVCTHSPANLGATYCGMGACANSAPVCIDGELNNESCAPLPPSAELCDGLDNNCDGLVDEGDNACGGVCP
ncbi:MAG: MopE-related protein, partial [Patescibacteria group bacterium]